MVVVVVVVIVFTWLNYHVALCVVSVVVLQLSIAASYGDDAAQLSLLQNCSCSHSGAYLSHSVSFRSHFKR